MYDIFHREKKIYSSRWIIDRSCRLYYRKVAFHGNIEKKKRKKKTEKRGKRRKGKEKEFTKCSCIRTYESIYGRYVFHVYEIIFL